MVAAGNEGSLFSISYDSNVIVIGKTRRACGIENLMDCQRKASTLLRFISTSWTIMLQNIVGDGLEVILDSIERFSGSMHLQVMGNPLHVLQLLHDLCSIAFLAHDGDGSF